MCSRALFPAGSRRVWGISDPKTDLADMSLDHFVSAGEQRCRDRDAKRLSGFEIDHEFELGRLFDRQLLGFRALDNFMYENRGVPRDVEKIDPVRHQTASFREFQESNRGEPLCRGKIDDRSRSIGIGQKPVIDDHNGLSLPFTHVQKCARQFVRSCRPKLLQLQLKRRGRERHCWENTQCYRIAWVDKNSNSPDLWKKLLEKLKPLRVWFWNEEGPSGDVPAGPVEAGNKAGPDRIAAYKHDNGNGCGGVLGRKYPGVGIGYENINTEMDQLGCQRGEPLVVSLCISELNDNIFALQIAKSAKSRPKSFVVNLLVGSKVRVQKPYSGDLSRLLRVRGKRPSQRPAKQWDKLAPPHSITSSARAASEGGTVRLRALAVLRLITNSYLGGSLYRIYTGS